jgi:uncharacterized membrane protein YqiK
MLLFVFMLIGGALAVGPWLVPALGTPAQLVLSSVGTLLLCGVSVASVFTRLYRRTSANLAFVRTGMGGAKVIKDGGTVVLPVLHQVIPVSLETMRLNVERRGPHALITRDNLRVDLSAEFYIKVQSNSDDILQAARSLGNRSIRADEVSELVQEKLVSALRTVAATKELVELHAKRDEFASAVQEILTHDLASNGLTLESVTISSLDQTDPEQLQERNVFDAQGLRKIAEITQRARVERNEIERVAERALVAKNVATKKQVLDLQREQAEFEAEQRMKVAIVQKAREKETREFSLSQDEQVARREIERDKAVQMAQVERSKAVEQAEIEKLIALVARRREQEYAEIEKRQSVEVAERTREAAVAETERLRAAAQAAMLLAEAERESAAQKVLTVKVQNEAEREAEKKLIAARQLITERKIREQNEADLLAYTEVKKAEGERQASELLVEARLRLADADAQAAARRAEGDRAMKMVAVNVEQATVEVERQRLANKQEFGEAALRFELERARIDAERDVRIHAAEGMARLMQGARVQLFGDPTTVAHLMQTYQAAAGLGMAADGFFQSLSPDAKDAAGRLISGLASAAGLGNGHGGNDPSGTLPTSSQNSGPSTVGLTA